MKHKNGPIIKDTACRNYDECISIVEKDTIQKNIDYKKLDDCSNRWLKKYGFTMKYIESIFLLGYTLGAMDDKRL